MMKHLIQKKFLLLGLIAILSLLAIPFLTNLKVQPVIAQEGVVDSDPLLGKSVLSYLFETKDPQIESSLQSLQKSLQLTNDQFATLTQAAHTESASLAAAKVESNSRLTKLKSVADQVKESIKFNASVFSILKSTQTKVQKLLGAKYPEFRNWINAWWDQERAYRNSEINTALKANNRSYKVFATHYPANTLHEVGLPDLNFQSSYRGKRPLPYKVPFYVDISFNGKNTSQFVKAVGPGNQHDQYWHSPSWSSNNQRRFQNLLEGHPLQFEAYFNNFNAGKDEIGRQVVNPDGIQLSPKAAAILGLKENQSAYVTIRILPSS